MRRFYTSQTLSTGRTIVLDPNETRHLRDVLRMTIGDEVFVFDGRGGEFAASIEVIGKNNSEVSVGREMVPTSPESDFQITLAATMMNGEKYDLVIQKAVELGVTSLIPLHTLRCEIRLADAGKRVDRWRRIALEATKQSGRARLMSIAEPCEFAYLAKVSAGAVLFSERDGAAFSSLQLENEITAFIGPKGGWDDSELRMARDQKITVITLGGRILRAETASIAIAAILQHRFGDLN